MNEGSVVLRTDEFPRCFSPLFQFQISNRFLRQKSLVLPVLSHNLSQDFRIFLPIFLVFTLSFLKLLSAIYSRFFTSLVFLLPSINTRPINLYKHQSAHRHYVRQIHPLPPSKLRTHHTLYKRFFVSRKVYAWAKSN